MGVDFRKMIMSNTMALGHYGMIKKNICVVLLTVLLASCITETTNPLAKKADREKSLQTSIAATIEYIKAGKIDSAFRHANKALKIDPKSAEAHNALALLYRRTSDTKLEEKHFKLAVRYDPKNAQVRNNYASFLYGQARYKDALYQLEKALKDPTYEKRDVVLENIGRCALKLGDLEKAESSFQRVLRFNTEAFRAHLELADLYFERGDYKEANRYLERFGHLTRHSARSLWLGIRLQRTLGNRDALASYELALRNLYPDSEEYQLYTETIKP